jgi:hypothetical protein
MIANCLKVFLLNYKWLMDILSYILGGVLGVIAGALGSIVSVTIFIYIYAKFYMEDATAAGGLWVIYLLVVPGSIIGLILGVIFWS